MLGRGPLTLMSTGKPTMERSPGNVGSAKDFSSQPSYLMCQKSHGQAPRRWGRDEKTVAPSAELDRYFQKPAAVGSGVKAWEASRHPQASVEIVDHTLERSPTSARDVGKPLFSGRLLE